MLERALEGGDVPIPGQPLCKVGVVSAAGDSIFLVLSMAPEQTAELRQALEDEELEEYGPVPVLKIGVAGSDDEYAPRLWELLHQAPGVPTVTDTDDPPRAPWCAVRLKKAAVDVQDSLVVWMGEWARYLAWTWIERTDAHGTP